MITIQLRIEMPKRKRAKWHLHLDVLRREDANSFEEATAKGFEETMEAAMRQWLDIMQGNGVAKNGTVTRIEAEK